MKLSDIVAFANPGAVATARLASAGIVALAGVAAAGALYWLVIGGPAHDRREAAKAHAAAVVSQGDAAAAKDAANVIAATGGHDAAVDAQTRTNADDISKAPGADVHIDPALDRTGRLSLCRRESYRGSARCRALLKPGP